MIKYMIYKYLGKDVRSLGPNMGSLRINYYRLKQLENVTDKSYLDFSEGFYHVLMTLLLHP